MRLPVSLYAFLLCAPLVLSAVVRPGALRRQDVNDTDTDTDTSTDTDLDDGVLELTAVNTTITAEFAMGALARALFKFAIVVGFPYGSGSTDLSANDADPTRDIGYLINVQIGAPPQQFHMLIDSGSSDTWVRSYQLPEEATVGRDVYRPQLSYTSRLVPNETWDIAYAGDTSTDASGVVYTDVMKLGSITIPTMGVEVATFLSEMVATAAFDGIFGLAFDSLNQAKPVQQKTPMDTLIADNLIKQPLYTVCFDKGSSNGFISFGSIQAAKAGVLTQNIFYTPVITVPGWWMVPSTFTTVNGHAVNVDPANTAILDTGTSLVLLSDVVVNTTYAAIPGAYFNTSWGLWMYPTGAATPSIGLNVGTRTYNLKHEDFNYGPDQGGFTIGAIQSRGAAPFDVFGDGFFKSTYVVFDLGQVRVGVAQR